MTVFRCFLLNLCRVMIYFRYLCTMTRRVAIRSILALLLFFTTTQMVAKRDSTLWADIKTVGTVYQQGQVDSSLVMARALLATAESEDDDLAQTSLHNMIGICLSDKGDKQGAREAFTRCVSIGEAHDYMQKATKTKNAYLFRIMLTAYAQLALNCKDAGLHDKSLVYAKKGIEWIPVCNVARLRVTALDSFAEILMDHKEYGLIYEPLKQGVQDALTQDLPDFALMMTSYLIKIEYEAMHRNPADIPWIKLGEQLMEVSKTKAAKTAFLAVTKLTLPKNEEPTTTRPSKVVEDSISKGQTSLAQTDSIQTRIEYVRVRNERIGIITTILILVLAAFILYALWQRRQRRKAASKARQQMTERYLEGQEEERSRLAKELHDGVSNQLLAIQMKLNEDGLTSQTMQLLNESREQVRRVSHELIPPEFDHATLDEVIRNYAASLDGLQQCEVSYVSTPADADWSFIDKTKALEIYRIIQEAVSNAFKHADATSVSIGLHLNEEHLKATVSDNGTRKDHKDGSVGIGTRTISQRAAAINGSIEFFQHQFGSTVQLTVNHQCLLNNV